MNFVAGQNFVELPLDFGRLISVEVPNSLQTTVQLTTLSDVQYLRGSALNDPFRYHVAVTFPTQSNNTEAPLPPRLDIWPEPAVDEENALLAVYLATWKELRDFDSVANIPIDVESLLVSLIQVMAKAYADPQQILAVGLSAIDQMPMVEALKKRYGMVQGNLGAAEGGIIPVDRTYVYRPQRGIKAGGS